MFASRLAHSISRRLRVRAAPAISPWEPIWLSYPGTWSEAARDAGGYAQPEILEQVRAATLAVTAGRAAYARDGVTFDTIEYSWPVLAAIFKAAQEARKPIDVVDFGGGLGTSYHQNRTFAGVAIGSWRIVEQPAFVECGSREFADDVVSFHATIEDAVKAGRPHLVLVSSVLQYLADPYATLDALCGVGAPTVVLDLLAVTDAALDTLTMQHLPTGAGWRPAYPTWYFSVAGFRARVPSPYRIEATFNAYVGNRLWVDNVPKGRYAGFILRRDVASETMRAS